VAGGHRGHAQRQHLVLAAEGARHLQPACAVDRVAAAARVTAAACTGCARGGSSGSSCPRGGTHSFASHTLTSWSADPLTNSPVSTGYHTRPVTCACVCVCVRACVRGVPWRVSARQPDTGSVLYAFKRLGGSCCDATNLVAVCCRVAALDAEQRLQRRGHVTARVVSSLRHTAPPPQQANAC
jgi:hypothetical protein